MEQPRILIVDDEQSVRFVLERTLRNQGYLLDAAANGSEAIEKIRRQRYDLLLLDLQMSPVNGIQVLDFLRKENADAVVIILTAHGTMESAVDALRLGAFDYLFKPATPEDIRQRVQDGLAQRQKNLRRQQLLGQIESLRQALVEMDEELAAPPDEGKRFVRSGKLVIDQYHRAATLDGRALDLTTTELNLLARLVEAAPRPVAPRQLVNLALGYDAEEAEAGELIKWHIHHLRQKIEPDPSHPRYIKTVRYAGYLWSG